MSGVAELKEIVGKLRGVAVGKLGEDAAPEVAKLVEAYLVGTIGSHQSPHGQAWQLRKDGAPPELGSKVAVPVEGDVVKITLRGKSYLHHMGIARGHVFRRVIPSNKLPDVWTKDIAEIMVKSVEKRLARG